MLFSWLSVRKIMDGLVWEREREKDLSEEDPIHPQSGKSWRKLLLAEFL